MTVWKKGFSLAPLLDKEKILPLEMTLAGVLMIDNKTQNMVKSEWFQLSPEQKREQRFSLWLNPPEVHFTSSEAKKGYQQRVQRFIDVFRVQKPDRVPVALPLGSIPAVHYGIDSYTVMHDSQKLTRVWSQFNQKYASELDCFASPSFIMPAKAYSLLEYKLYTWPGHGLSQNARGYQFVEGEYMKADEYDAFIRDSSDFFLRVYLPRVCGTLESYRKVAHLIDSTELPTRYFNSFANTEVLKMQQTLMDISKELLTWNEAIDAVTKQGQESGYPPSFIMGAFAKAPYDTIGDAMRGTQGIMKDMYRQPERLLEALDLTADLTINSAVSSINTAKAPNVFFPLHKGADGWMSQKQFETFYWPPLKKVMNALINEGAIISLFAEGHYDSRLESVNEFPKGTVHWHFENTDLARAKKILGATCCIQGNLPVSILVTGTREEVKKHCRQLIEDCGGNGGYILSASTSEVDESKLDNLLAMVEAAREYGAYSG